MTGVEQATARGWEFNPDLVCVAGTREGRPSPGVELALKRTHV